MGRGGRVGVTDTRLEAEHWKGQVTDCEADRVNALHKWGAGGSERLCTGPESQQPGNEELRPDPGPTPGPKHFP